MIDVVIVGGGPAGLSAALVLGRARRSTIVLDDHAAARNAASRGVHGFVGHDGIAPAALRRAAEDDLARYADVSRRAGRAVGIERIAGGLRVELAEGGAIEGRRVLLACGLVDVLPKIPGLRERWGVDVFSCPFCHGWEARDRTWGVIALQKAMLETIPLASTWTKDVILFTNARTDLDPIALERLVRRGVRIDDRKVVAIGGDDDRLDHVEVEGGRVACDALWIHPGNRHVDLVLYAGLALDDQGLVRLGENHETSMRGVHACGDLASGAWPQAIQAAASGARAGMDLVQLLTD